MAFYIKMGKKVHRVRKNVYDSIKQGEYMTDLKGRQVKTQKYMTHKKKKGLNPYNFRMI